MHLAPRPPGLATLGLTAGLAPAQLRLHSRRTMIALSHAIEEQAAASGPETVLIVTFQRLSLPRSDAHIKMCGWCKQVLVEGRGWLEVEDAAEALQLFRQTRLPPQITHAICEPCFSGAMAALE